MTVFQFGENWSRFASQIDKKNVEAAVINLERLLPELSQFESRQGRKPSFLDIGCGSGIHAVAATLLGANVQAFDIDEISVQTTNNLFDKLGLKMMSPAFEASILEVPIFKKFDFVYSWGVLHHTGNLFLALDRASQFLNDDETSRLAIALYRKTRLCKFWKLEKKLYSRSNPWVQKLIRSMFGSFWDVLRLLNGENPIKHRRRYFHSRGMSYSHDLHDWLGGYPYESATSNEILTWSENIELQEVRTFVYSHKSLPSGICGSGCDEFVFKRSPEISEWALWGSNPRPTD